MNVTDRPASIFFDVMKHPFGLTPNETCVRLLTDKPMLWFSRKPVIPRDVARDTRNRDRLHNKIKDRLPGEQPPEVFRPLEESMPALLASISRSMTRRSQVSSTRVCSLIYDTVVETAEQMKWSLQVHTRGSDIYDNILDGIRSHRFDNEQDRALAALSAFTGAGLICNPMVFGPMVCESIRAMCGVSVLDVVALDARPLPNDRTADVSSASFGLQRFLPGGVRGRRHTLDPDGTLVGSMPETDGDYVADVDRTVSPEHLFIYEEDGRWVAEGLGAVYGTSILRPGTLDPIVVEPPLSLREDAYYAAEIMPGDILVLGNTRFEVQLFLQGE